MRRRRRRQGEGAGASEAGEGRGACRNQGRSSLTGNRLDVKVERNGEVVQEVNADPPAERAGHGVHHAADRDEVPFAVVPDGRLTPERTRTARVASFGDVAKPAARPSRLERLDCRHDAGYVRLGPEARHRPPLGDSLATLRSATARNAGFGLLFIVIALIGIVPISTRLTRHLSTLSDAATASRRATTARASR